MIYAITGRMRSGTSAMAEVFHTLGWQVAVQQLCPLPPTYRPDWECPALSMKCMKGEADRKWLESYLRWRLSELEVLGLFQGVSLKSPYLALFREELEQAADAVGEHVRWVVMQRPDGAVARSMAQWPVLSVEDNVRIDEASRAISTAVRVPYDHLVNRPKLTIANTVSALGMRPAPGRLEDAASRVLQPTT